jgi:hypothetical protein
VNLVSVILSTDISMGESQRDNIEFVLDEGQKPIQIDAAYVFIIMIMQSRNEYSCFGLQRFVQEQ